jgi:uncharacterized membrane protein YjjP (DUF1212 family)
MDDRRRRKWVVLGIVGLISGLFMLYFFRSIPIASTTAAAAVIVVIVLKHLALAIAVGSPLAAFFKSIKPTLRDYCPFAGNTGGDRP